MKKTQVLIVVAGPTGLTLALWLDRMGISFRIIDKIAKPETTSRATVVQARNLELFNLLGLTEKAISEGVKFKDMNMWARGVKVAHVAMGDGGIGIGPYPYSLVLPQNKLEGLLIAELTARGVSIERDTELISCQDSSDGVKAVIRSNENIENLDVLYVAGCDGAHSVVRKQIGVSFEGGQYTRTFYVADALCAGAITDGQVHAALDESDFFMAFPLKGESNLRLVGTLEATNSNAGQIFHWEDVNKRIYDRMKVEVRKINWFSTYRVHHRIASNFEKGNIFLLGDAGHIHSPVGGQGMNTGIGDAVNLAWKLRDVINGRSKKDLLITYETERIAFAQKLVKTTDRAFTFVTAKGKLANFLRLSIVPHVLSFLFRFSGVRRFLYSTISQVGLNYEQSALSKGSVEKIRGGDRLPWAGDNFEPLKTLDWQIHIYGNIPQELTEWGKNNNIPVHQLAWTDAAGKAGFKLHALYVIRPDGYIGMAQAEFDLAELKKYFLDWLQLNF